MFKRLLVLTIALTFLSVPAFAGDRPEFDAVGDDSANYFNDAVKDLVVANNPWNTNSAFPEFWRFINDVWIGEQFYPPAQLTADLCFPNYVSAYTQWRRTALYTWKIVLQMDPQSDLDINIVDCVVKHNSQTVFGENPFEGADQTGRYQLPDGTPVFNPGANPMVTATAYPGPYAVYGFTAPFVLTNRTQGGLYLVPFDRLPYTSKALWEEGLVAVMPDYGAGYPLSAGDMIKIDILIPPINTVDIRYGSDNVVIKYVGITGTIATP